MILDFHRFIFFLGFWKANPRYLVTRCGGCLALLEKCSFLGVCVFFFGGGGAKKRQQKHGWGLLKWLSREDVCCFDFLKRGVPQDRNYDTLSMLDAWLEQCGEMAAKGCFPISRNI